MGKQHGGWSLSPDRRTEIFFVRFTHKGKRYNLSTRTTDRAAAQIEAATIYAETVSGQRRQSRERREVAETMGEWLALHEGVWSDAHFDARKSRSRTIANYFGTTDEITEESIKRFFNARLSKVTREAAKLDRSTLKMFYESAADQGYVPPMIIPPLPKGIKGKSAIDRPHVRLKPSQAGTIIEALPERTKITRKPIRTMMEVEWDTGLRAYGLWRLEAPKHYSRSGLLYVSADIDKEGFARTLKLRPETSARLDELGDGLLFGKFSYLWTLRQAAHRTRHLTGLTAYECDHLDLRDFRHAAATALWHQSNSLAAVAFMLGHTQETTTVRYLDLHENVYTEAIEKRFSVAEVVAVGDDVSVPSPNVLQSLPNDPGAHGEAPARM
jgi:site-specific recombinase XerC